MSHLLAPELSTWKPEISPFIAVRVDARSLTEEGCPMPFLASIPLIESDAKWAPWKSGSQKVRESLVGIAVTQYTMQDTVYGMVVNEYVFCA